MRKRPKTTIKHQRSHTKREREREELTSSTVKLLIIICQIFKEHLEGVDKWCLGNQQRNLGKMSLTSSRILGLTLKYSYIQTWKNFTTPLQHSQNNFSKPTHSQKLQTSPTIQMEHHLSDRPRMY